MEASVVSSAPVPDEAFLDLAVLEGNQGQASLSAEQLMELSLSSCPNNGSEDSDEQEGTSHRCFSRLTSEKTLARNSLMYGCRGTGRR